MRRPRLLLGLAALVVLATVGGVTVWAIAGDDPAPLANAPGSPGRGDPAPDFELPALDGSGTVRLSELRGRPVVLNFWASWCNPCREEFALLRDARTAHRDQGLEVVGVSYRDMASDSRRFARRFGARWPLLRDPDGAVAATYGVRQLPQTLFIRRDGTVALRLFGVTDEATLDAAVERIVRR